ncbi:hypothetical protein RBB77_05545 [Tunturibacter psychrotolerans]|uniref:Uncharacterized protein n=1 Tax=Tunturiibacter psychrotolerans TaxID=3069686 RepID=A0AAU7ZTM4_9BACT
MPDFKKLIGWLGSVLHECGDELSLGGARLPVIAPIQGGCAEPGRNDDLVVGGRERRQQIPFGDANKKDEGNCKSEMRESFVALRNDDKKNRQRQRQRRQQILFGDDNNKDKGRVFFSLRAAS